MSDILKKLVNPYNLLKAFALLVISVNVQGQSVTQNYIQTLTPRVGGLTNNTLLNTAATNNYNVETTIQYFDGLGRLTQTIQKQGSPLGNDMVQPVIYDQYGRDSVSYLPYSYNSATPGAYRPNAVIGTNGAYNASEQYAFYQQTGQNYVNTPYPYSLTGYEPSPLNRVVEQGEAGLAWQFTGPGDANSTNHTVRTVYPITNDQTSTFLSTPTTNNAGSKVVALYTTAINSITQTQGLVRTNNATYGPGQLYVTISRDENWQPANGCVGTTEEYKDKQGHIVLKRIYNLNGSQVQMLSTYYVYDDYNNLAFVIPPTASPDSAWTPNQTALDNLCYQYQYDQRNRMVAKKIPGKGWEYMIYNVLDQVIGTQDSVQRMAIPNQQVSFVKYDAQGRAVMTGYYTLAGSTPGVNYRASMQAAANGQTVLWETETSGAYSNVTIPTTGATPLSYNYYDDYSAVSLPSAYSAPTGASVKTLGLLTATQTAVLNTPADLLWKANYYDNLGRTIKSYSQHYVGGHTSYNTANYDAVANYYNFTNQIDTTIRQHYGASLTSPKVIIANFYTYDQVGRRLLNTEQLTGRNGVAQAANVLSQAHYNELGQLYSKNIGGTGTSASGANIALGTSDVVSSGQPVTVIASNSITINPNFMTQPGANFTAQIGSSVQTIMYTYNERGWLTSMTPVVGGNFAETLAYNSPTGTATPQYNGNISQFSYNSPNMATLWGQAATYINTVNYTYDNLNRFTQSTSSLAESDEAVTYDLNGNIKTLVRNGPMAASLGYAYLNNGMSNQLSAVSDSGASYRTYAYNGNGNALSNGGASSDGGLKTITYNILNLPQFVQEGSITVTYAYDAKGTKLRDLDGSGITWDYDNGIVYQQGWIYFIQNEEGRASSHSDSVTYQYSYNLTDYLGNVRASYDNGGTGGAFRIIQENNYYPFGLTQLYYDNAHGNYYLYNGKESEFDLIRQYDFGARFYDPMIARWTTVDPLAEKMRRFSPYDYGDNNPIRNIDPDGREIINEADRVTYTQNDAKLLFTAIKQQSESNKPFNIHFVYESKTEGIYKNTLNAFRQGKPEVLHYDNDKQRQQARRAAATSSYPAAPGLSKDEYPYASTFEGGSGAVVANVPVKEQFSQGGSLSALYRTMTQGEAFIVIPVPRDKEPDEQPESVTQPSFKPIFPVLSLPTQVPLPNVPLPTSIPEPTPAPTFEIPDFFAL